MADKNKVYIAGPLFSQAERDFNLRIAEICKEEGFEVFLPQRDAPTLGPSPGKTVFVAELHANEAADLIVANLDGVDVDSGTAWELGYAVARGKTVIGLRTDWRRFSIHERVNLMIEESSFLVDSCDTLVSALRAYLAGPT